MPSIVSYTVKYRNVKSANALSDAALSCTVMYCDRGTDR